MKYLRILYRLFATFGFRAIYLILPIYRFFYSGFTSLTLAADRLFFREYAKKTLHKPVFIIGHPRSGTTFLHRFMAEHCHDLEANEMWKMLFPSLTARKFARMWIVRNKDKTPAIYDPNIHKTSLASPETDDAAIFLRFFDGLFYWIYFEAWRKITPRQVEEKLKKLSGEQVFLDYLKQSHRRNVLYPGGRRMLSKSFSFMADFEQLHRNFPNGKFIFLMRDPKSAIPSSMSLVESVQSKLHHFDKPLAEKKSIYFGNLYAASQAFYKSMHQTLLNPNVPKEQILLVTYSQLKNDFGNTMRRIIGFCELQQSPDLEQALEAQLAKQTDYKSKHSYDLKKFGITAEQIERDFGYIYDNYDL